MGYTAGLDRIGCHSRASHSHPPGRPLNSLAYRRHEQLAREDRFLRVCKTVVIAALATALLLAAAALSAAQVPAVATLGPAAGHHPAPAGAGAGR